MPDSDKEETGKLFTEITKARMIFSDIFENMGAMTSKDDTEEDAMLKMQAIIFVQAGALLDSALIANDGNMDLAMKLVSTSVNHNMECSRTGYLVAAALFNIGKQRGE